MPPKQDKPPIYLLDTMAFIFRAYHAMQRSRPMTTRNGTPTAATYVFVNMINKLRADFKPEYLAAVYDVGAPVHRNELAKQLKDVQKFNIKTQAFETIEHGGYKANRAETPPDLIQQQPYIRRALEAFRIPIVYYEGYEADDVIGTLSCYFSALGHHVYVVSPDKDMMQLVNSSVSILNPTKDNLILNPAKVEEVLGVPPERVIDVMALRGDSIDNIPGAPGIGDKGSVEIIQNFGTVEAALDGAEQVKKKTYRESLLNNRDNILLSKELVTIHTSVPITPDLGAMLTQPVDNAACRALFTELEFTTLLKDLAPDIQAAKTTYNVKAVAEDLLALLAEARSGENPGLSVALIANAQAISEEIAADAADPDSNPDVELEPEPSAPQTMSLFGAPEPVETKTATANAPAVDPACRFGLAVTAAHAIEVSLDTAGLREALTDATLPKRVHDYKAILRALQPHDLTLAGDITDVMLESYLLNPTHGSHSLIDIAARTTSVALLHQPTKENSNDPLRLAEAAAAVARLAPAITQQLNEAAQVHHNIPKDEPTLGSAITKEMLYADRQNKQETGNRKQEEPISEVVILREAEDLLRSNAAEASSLNPNSSLADVYTHLDLPLTTVLLRMEQNGVAVDPTFLREMSSRLAVTIDDLAEKVYASSGHRFNIGSPKQLGGRAI